MNTSTMDFDMAKMKEAMRKAAAIPRPEFDMVVTTEAIRKRLKEYVASLHPVPMQPSGIESLSLYGIEILAYGDEQDATAAAITLRVDGKRVMLVLEEKP